MGEHDEPSSHITSAVEWKRGDISRRRRWKREHEATSGRYEDLPGPVPGSTTPQPFPKVRCPRPAGRWSVGAPGPCGLLLGRLRNDFKWEDRSTAPWYFVTPTKAEKVRANEWRLLGKPRHDGQPTWIPADDRLRIECPRCGLWNPLTNLTRSGSVNLDSRDRRTFKWVRVPRV